MEKALGVIRSAIKKIDPVLFICSVLLSLISIVTIYGAVDNFGMSKLKMQVFIFVFGTLITFVIAFFDYRVIVKKPPINGTARQTASIASVRYRRTSSAEVQRQALSPPVCPRRVECFSKKDSGMLLGSLI